MCNGSVLSLSGCDWDYYQGSEVCDLWSNGTMFNDELDWDVVSGFSECTSTLERCVTSDHTGRGTCLV